MIFLSLAMEKEIAADPTEIKMRDFELIKQQLIEIDKDKIQGLIVRSKSKFVEEGEKSSKYFFDLEKRNAIKKHMRKLKLDSGEEISDQKTILYKQQEFYKKLYSTKINNETNFDNFLKSPTLPKLSETQKQKCDLPISLTECKEALDTFENGKSPGNDGITTEFYRM